MTVELLVSKNLSDMTDAELQELRESISKIEIERYKILAEKVKKVFAQLSDEG